MKILSTIFIFLFFQQFSFGKESSISIIDPFLEIELDGVAFYNEMNQLIGYSKNGYIAINNSKENQLLHLSKLNYKDTTVYLKDVQNKPIRFSLLENEKKRILEREKNELDFFLKETKTQFQDSTTMVFSIVDIPATLIGGDTTQKALRQFIAKNIIYPMYSIENNIQEKLYFNLIIETDGTVKYVQIVKGNSRCLIREAKRVLKLTKWNPAIYNGKKVRSVFTTTVNYRIS